jgi:rubredoxin
LFICELSDASVGSNQSRPLTYGDYQLSMKGEVGAAFRLYKESGKPPMQQTQWQCSVCGYVYDGETPFERLPETWLCPVCGEGKGVFERVV